MMLAFLIDQVQEYGCAFFQAARQRFHSRTSLWIKIKGLFTELLIASWETLWRAIIYGHGSGSRAIQYVLVHHAVHRYLLIFWC